MNLKNFRIFSKKVLFLKRFLKQTVNKENDERICETPVGVAGQVRPRRHQKVGMLIPRRPIVTHA